MKGRPGIKGRGWEVSASVLKNFVQFSVVTWGLLYVTVRFPSHYWSGSGGGGLPTRLEKGVLRGTRRPDSSPHPKGPTIRRFYEHATGGEASLPRQGQALQAVPTQCHSPDSGIL